MKGRKSEGPDYVPKCPLMIFTLHSRQQFPLLPAIAKRCDKFIDHLIIAI